MSKLTAVNVPYAGLGNRIRFTLSMDRIAQAAGYEFQYYWPVDDQFGAAMTDLWVYDRSLIGTRPSPRTFMKTTVEPDLTVADEHLTLESSADITWPGHDVKSWESALAELEPVDSIKSRVQTLAQSLPSQFVGVSIRAHEKAHAETKKHSPVSWFIKRMHDIVDANANTKFYLSIDENQAQSEIEKEFSGRIVTQHDKGTYNSKEAITASVVDLYMLAGAKHVLTPYYSSFPYMAYALANRTLSLENSKQLWLPGGKKVTLEPTLQHTVYS